MALRARMLRNVALILTLRNHVNLRLRPFFWEKVAALVFGVSTIGDGSEVSRKGGFLDHRSRKERR